MENLPNRLNSVVEKHFSGKKKLLAEAIGVTPQALNKYTNEGRVPGGVVLAKFIEIGININWLLTGAGNMLIDQDNVVQEPVSAYKPGKPLDQAILHARDMLTQSDISEDRQLELIREFTKTIAIEQNTAYFEQLGKK
jgi:transcriptional regulator with XRE-family HTH domain